MIKNHNKFKKLRNQIKQLVATAYDNFLNSVVEKIKCEFKSFGILFILKRRLVDYKQFADNKS